MTPRTPELLALEGELERLLSKLAAHELPALIAMLASATAHAQLRLSTPPPPLRSEAGPELHDASEIARRLGVPEHFVYESARRGRLPSVRVGRYVRFRLEEVRAAIAAMNGPAAQDRQS